MTYDIPLYLDNGVASTYAAGRFRMDIAAAFPQRSGVLGVNAANELKVSQRGAGANQSVDVAVGRAVIGESSSTDALGWRAYLASLSGATQNVALTAPPGSNSRYDMIVATVRDDTISGAVNDWTLAVVQGTAAASPTEPATPAQSLVLARVLRTAGQATVTNSVITDRRVFLQGWNSYTPTWRGTGSNPVVGTGGQLTGRWRYLGHKFIKVQIFAKFGTAGTDGGTGFYSWDLPFSMESSVNTYMLAGTADAYDASLFLHYGGCAMVFEGTPDYVLFKSWDDGNTIMDDVPFVFSPSDVITLDFAYEIE